MRLTMLGIFLISTSILIWSQKIKLIKDEDHFSNSIQNQNEYSFKNIKKNSIYFEIAGKGILGSVNYDRIIPFSKKNAIALGASIGFLADIIPSIHYLYGNSKKFIEIGLGYSYPEKLVVPHIGYRYHGNKGFVFRSGGMYFASTEDESFGDFPWLGLSFGYTF